MIATAAAPTACPGCRGELRPFTTEYPSRFRPQVRVVVTRRCDPCLRAYPVSDVTIRLASPATAPPVDDPWRDLGGEGGGA